LIKSLLEFGLTRSVIIVLGLLVFCAAGLVAFSKLRSPRSACRRVQRPLATVVVGGMFVGPLLLLVVAPALRNIFLSKTSRKRPVAVTEGNPDG
jgi:Cu/Ag efflux pump CusA